MKLYQVAQGVNPRRVIIYLAEKGIVLERVEVDALNGAHKSPAFLAMNPAGLIPVLELDDGTFLPESAVIVEYLEELYPNPPMLGITPAERAKVRALERIANDLIVRSGTMFLHSHARFKARLKQCPEVAEALRPVVQQSISLLEHYLGQSLYLAGSQPTIADCTLFAALQTCNDLLHEPLHNEAGALGAWYRRFAQRPSSAY